MKITLSLIRFRLDSALDLAELKTNTKLHYLLHGLLHGLQSNPTSWYFVLPYTVYTKTFNRDSGPNKGTQITEKFR